MPSRRTRLATRGRHRKREIGLDGHMTELRMADLDPPARDRPGDFAEWSWTALTDPEQPLRGRVVTAIRALLLDAIESASEEVLHEAAPDLVLACRVLRESVDQKYAREVCRRLVRGAPSREEFWTELGISEESVTEWSAARDAYQEAWRLLTNIGDWDEEAGCRLAWSLIKNRQFDEAEALLVEIVNHVPAAKTAPELLRIARSPSARV